MNEETTKALTNLAKMFGSDRVLTSQEIDKVLNGILKMLVENKKETEALNVETKAQVEKLLNKFLDKYAVFVEDMKTLEGDVSDIQSEMLKKVENKISEVTYLLEEAKKINVKEEKLELDDIVQAVMENITLPEVQEMMEISGERIIDLINETANTDENKISWSKIKDIPEFFTTPQTKKGKLKEGGMSPTVLRQAVDLDHSTRADGYGIVWNEALGKHIYSAAGGGGGSGTVNSGTQYRLAYYATTGSAVSQLTAITADRVLVSNTNGLPVHSSVTATTLGYLDATSSIQTQLDAKGTFTLPSLTAGSVLFSDGTTIAQDRSNFFWDDTKNELGIGTNTPEYVLHVKGATSGGHVLFERTTSSTNAVAGVLRLRATSSGDMADGFGAQLGFHIQDTAAVDNQIGVITVTRYGADNTGIINLIANNAGSGSVGLAVMPNQNVSVGAQTPLGSRLDITTTRSAANTSNVGVNFSTRSGTFTDTSSTGTVSLILGHSFYSNTFAASSATTYTDAANVYINGAPSAGTNVTITNTYALWVDAGVTRLDGATWFGATVIPFTNDGAALGSTTNSFSDLFLASGAVININNSNWVATHTAGILTVGTGDLRVTTAGTNTASVVTVGGTQTLSAKTLTTPAWTGTMTGSSTPAITTAAATALSITTGTTGALTIDSGTTGAINIGTNANAKTITIGNATGATAVTINAGTGSILIGDNAIARTVNLATGGNSTQQLVTIGSTASASSLALRAGTGNITYSSPSHIFQTNTATDDRLILLPFIGGAARFDGTITSVDLSAARTWTFQDASYTVVGRDTTDTLTNKTLTAPKFADLGFIADANGNEILIFDTTASAVNEITFVNAATTTAPQIQATGGDTNIDLLLVPKGTGIVKGELKRFMVRLVASDTDQATGTAIGGDYRISNRAITVKAVGSYCDTAGTTGTYTVDINEAGTTIMATNKITVDSTEKSSETAATPPAVTDAAIAADAIITFDVDAVQTTKAKGLVVWIDYVYA